MKKNNSLKTYLTAIGISLTCVFLIAWLRGIFTTTTSKEVFHILCDGFFIVGVMDICLALLVFVSNEGAFDMIIYGVLSFINLFRASGKKKYDTYYDYHVAKSGKKTNSWFLLVIGVVLLLIAVLMLYMYKQF